METTTDFGEIVVYQPDEITRLEVQINNETVWLNRQQLAILFNRDIKTIGKHVKNALAEELKGMAVVANFATTATDGKQYSVEHYNLDMILSIGYRVKSANGIIFRRWANDILKGYLLKGYSLNTRLYQLENAIDRHIENHARILQEHESLLEEHSQKIDFFIKTSLPPVEGIFFDGQIYDAYTFAARLIRKAARRIILIDNYIDDTILTLLDKRQENVSAIIYTQKITKELQLDIRKHNEQYKPIEMHLFRKSHDRFLIIDNEMYLIGASLKDLGKKWFGFTLLKSVTPDEIIQKLTNN